MTAILSLGGGFLWVLLLDLKKGILISLKKYGFSKAPLWLRHGSIMASPFFRIWSGARAELRRRNFGFKKARFRPFLYRKTGVALLGFVNLFMILCKGAVVRLLRGRGLTFWQGFVSLGAAFCRVAMGWEV